MTPDGPAPVEAVWDNMRARRDRGEVVRADDYLPETGTIADTERALDIVYAEYCLREEAGEGVDLAEYLQRFPALGPGLERQIVFHNAVTALAAEPTASDPFPTFLPTGGPIASAAPPLRTVAVVCSAPTTLGRVADRVRLALTPHCGERTRWYCRPGGFVAEAVSRFLAEEKQVRLDGTCRPIGGTVADTQCDPAPGTWTPSEPTRAEVGFEEDARNADLVVVFWDGVCPETAAFLDRCRARRADHLVAFV